MADRGSLLLTGGGGAGDEGSEQPQPELPGWRAHVSPELAGKWASTQAKAKALVAMDPRDAYRALSDPSDPVHENMPLLRPDSRTPLGAPVVEATVGHPTPKEMRAGFCSACCGACGFIIVALVVAGGIFASSSAVACTQAAGNAKMDAVPAGCRRQKQLGDGMEEDFSIPQINDPLPMTMAECNTCSDAFDGVCDELPPTKENPAGAGDCAFGTDGFDCVVANLNEASAARAAATLTAPEVMKMGPLLTLTFLWQVLVTLVSVVVLPLVICTGRFVNTLPMISDQVHEIIRSRGLAVVESTAIFLYAVAIYYDLRLCHSSFIVNPSSIEITEESRWPNMWPSGMAKTVAAFRPEDSMERLVMFLALAGRYVMCNLANNHWQAAGKNITGAAFVFGVISSWWSLLMVGSDARFCRYPTATGSEVEAGYCTILGAGLPDDGVPSRSFLADCSLMQASGWNDTEIGYFQRFETLPPGTRLHHRSSTQEVEVAIAPSRERAFADAARDQALKEANRTGFHAPIFPEDSGADMLFPPLDGVGLSSDCPVATASLLEAVQQYAIDCENNSRMRESTLLVSGLALLNLIEGLFMLKIAVSVLSEGSLIGEEDLQKLPEKHARHLEHVYSARRAIGSEDATWLSRLVRSHAEVSLDDTSSTFRFPVRLLASVAVSSSLILMLMSSVDFTAVQIARTSDKVETFYNYQVVPLLRQQSNLTETSYLDQMKDLGLPQSYHNAYFDEHPVLPARYDRPGFHTLDSDCPCSLIHAVTGLAGDIAEHVAALATAGGSAEMLDGKLPSSPGSLGRRRILQAVGEACPPNSHDDPDQGCTCNDGFVSDGQGCVVDTIEFHVKALSEILQRNETGLLVKCTMQTARMLYEPMPFAVRYAGIISCGIAFVSTALFMLAFRRKAQRLQALVDEHFDPVNGWPKDPAVLHEEDVRLLTGGKRSWELDYVYLNRLPSFIGLYCGNCICAFAVHTVLWTIVLYLATCTAIPPGSIGSTLALLLPVVLESALKKVIWGKIVDSKQGIRHPRLYAYVDVLLSLLSTVTGPIKTFLRVAGAIVCLFAHLFRSDVSMMLDRSFLPLDPHFSASLGLLTGMRVQMEYQKIRRHSLDATSDNAAVAPAGGSEGDAFPMVELGAQSRAEDDDDAVPPEHEHGDTAQAGVA